MAVGGCRCWVRRRETGPLDLITTKQIHSLTRTSACIVILACQCRHRQHIHAETQFQSIKSAGWVSCLVPSDQATIWNSAKAEMGAGQSEVPMAGV